MSQKLSRSDVVEGAYIGLIIRSLFELGIMDSLQYPRSVRFLAERHRVDVRILEPLLDFLCQRSDLFTHDGDKYYRSLTGSAKETEDCIFALYLDTYWAMLDQSAAVMRGKISGATFVNRSSYATAFATLSRSGFPEIADVFLQIGADNLLDVGCGAAGLLISMAQRKQEFRGWGIDSNPDMCLAAKERIHAGKLEDRVEIYHGSSLDVIPHRSRMNIKMISACNLLNEFCFGEKEGIRNWLLLAKEIFPRRVLVVADYYGELGGKTNEGFRSAKLHDVVQVLSGQGVPPGELSEWTRIYDAAGCTLMHVCNIECDKFRRFMHFVFLGVGM